jgi:pimeloyl-ACP methyl ester carboxylesterase
LLGHSWGGLLAGLYATSHPDRVERIVLVGADPPAREPIWSRLDPTRGLLAEEVETLRELSDWPSATNPLEACRAFWRLALRPRFAAPERQAWMRGDVCDAPLDALVRASRAPHTRESLGAWDVRVELARVRAPVLVIHGEQDVTPVSAARAWATTLPEARILIVPDAGHFPHVERPDAFFPAVRTFLEGRWPEKARAT